MSLTLATVADALIEFILSLLRDPDAAREFEDDPIQALAGRGLQHVGPSDVAAVAPTIIERTHVVQVPVPVSGSHGGSSERHDSDVVNEIRQVTSHFQWVDDRDTVVDQSVNQNIWADGDVTQTFDNQANVASGDDAVAAGGDATVDKTWDDSTTIEADDDVNIGNDTDVAVIEDSQNEQTDASTTTDDSTTVVIEDSSNEQTESSDAGVDESTDDGDANDIAVAAGPAPVDAPPQDPPVDGTSPVAPDEAIISDEQTTAEAVDAGSDAEAQYVEVDIEDDDAFTGVDSLNADEITDDDTF
ncbi:IniB N-terminal domain-containing protein [Leifsonia sp. YIM 134122]|uniref:IniB N-terminal domain-containing protein n=1 Tax=Leifsonia stereocauli TaxID=3134136 RepID=A0ABU9W0M6_9MICO